MAKCMPDDDMTGGWGMHVMLMEEKNSFRDNFLQCKGEERKMTTMDKLKSCML